MDAPDQIQIYEHTQTETGMDKHAGVEHKT